jgi:LPXTG-site transpeptidase (sortase) family protein
LHWRTWLGYAFIVVGICGLLVPFLSFTLASPDDVLLVDMGYVIGTPYPWPVDSASPSGTVLPPTPTPDPEHPEIAERLLIPELGISMPILPGDQNRALERGAWLTGSRPGVRGNAVIFGHRFRYLPPLSNTMFRLGGIDYGDTFTVRWEGRDLTYVVREIRVIEPTELSVVEDKGDERVTLITCTPVWSTSHRLVVVGFPVPGAQ